MDSLADSPVDSRPSPADGLPPGLRGCWHPVAYGPSLGSSPLAATLLGEPLVLWRDSQGKARAFRDLCLHRGTALSLGSVQGDEIVCPYHGWHYAPDGRCTLMPQLEDQGRVPPKARADAYRCMERYHLVWVALEEPRWPLPQVPELEADGWATVLPGPYPWSCDASRQLENFTDFAHFPFVHPYVLGDPERTVIPPYGVSREGSVLRYAFDRQEATDQVDSMYPEDRARRGVAHTTYELHLPFTIILRTNWGGPQKMVNLFVSQPVGRDRCIGYQPISINFNLDRPVDERKALVDLIFSQDQRVVESQRPDQVPFDLAAELHLRFDAVAVNYRRAMREMGLA